MDRFRINIVLPHEWGLQPAVMATLSADCVAHEAVQHTVHVSAPSAAYVASAISRTVVRWKKQNPEVEVCPIPINRNGRKCWKFYDDRLLKQNHRTNLAGWMEIQNLDEV